MVLDRPSTIFAQHFDPLINMAPSGVTNFSYLSRTTASIENKMAKMVFGTVQILGTVVESHSARWTRIIAV